ncbi:MAG: hypothetical protein A2729_04835 [Candidatus Buchananbacteria bacterium RIFCSPHIGHO2_01_FULL_39_14]|uniref:Magnesium transporter CorA n=1 Tax=Candidatus Buchananbacteria bacterium RIFCSPHIGHO2_01_FULL_39_14 TaxID=1797532 RepID=A0A1G1XRX5_9BACT|nr:MAG: hypothetical protein A2729_04835 [Candidatus Buchananbacteria bacterium RIFCSPHIGHO2_01_FULL_39_14]OGY49591.1 MAG: hypothetical protein A3D39_02160 [Candidatus Buchananbacteria bacterium RIFCSPHIGHO2_02_FULL_39_17]
MPIKTVKAENFTWYFINEFNGQDLIFLKNNFKFHPLDLRDCSGEIQRSKLDVYKNYFFLVFQLPLWDKGRKKIPITQAYFFIGKDYLVTITREKIKFLNTIFYKVINNHHLREEAFAKDSGYLLYLILDDWLRNVWNIHNDLEQEIAKIENDIEEGKSKKTVYDLASLRRLVLKFKTVIDSQKLVTNRLSRIDVSFLKKEIHVYFDDLDDFVEKNWFLLESYKDRILSMQEINESLISFRTNQIMKVLTSFSVAILPLTLLSGIYGMNVDLPFVNHPNFIWLLFGLFSAIIIGIFIYLKNKDWI